MDKPGRDIRSLVVGDEVVYAVYRRAGHWITNTARGGETLPCEVTPAVERLSLAAAGAVGGGIVAIDLLEGERISPLLQGEGSGVRSGVRS